MKILFLCGRELSYPRNQVVFHALERIGHVDLIHSHIRQRSILFQSFIDSMRALPAVLMGHYDLVYIGFFGHLMMLPVGLIKRQPVLFDAFVSTFDTLITDRQVAPNNSLTARLAFWLDRTACLLADHILLDTSQQVDYFINTFHFKEGRFSSIPVGCDEALFRNSPYQPGGNPLKVLYYCTYLPLHGAEIVVQAAALLKDYSIRFRMIGTGIEYKNVRKLALDLEVEKIEFVNDVPINRLPAEIEDADICLGGHFGTSAKASRVIPGKIYQMLAVGRPVIAAHSVANLGFMTDKVNALFCQPGDAQSLAQAILELQRDPGLREQLAIGGYALFKERASETIIHEELASLVMDLCQQI